MPDTKLLTDLILASEQQKKDATVTDAGFSLENAAKYNPESFAGDKKLAERAGFDPFSVADNPFMRKEAEYKARQGIDLNALHQTHPKTTAALADPVVAALTHDDVGGMQAVEEAWTFLANSSSALVSSLPQVAGGLWGVARGASDVFLAPYSRLAAEKLGTPDVAKSFSEYAEGAQQRLAYTTKRLTPESDSILGAGYYSGLQSLGISAMTLPIAAAGAPAAARALMSAVPGGEAYGRARDKGIAPLKAATFGLSQAAVEYATEKTPMGKLLGDITAGTPFFKMLTKQMAAEIPGEQVATIVQDANEWAVLNPEKTLSDYLKERPSAAVQTLVATIVGVGGMVSTVKGLEFLTSDTQRNRETAKAEGVHEALTKMSQAAAASKLRERDPAAFKQFMQNMAEDSDLKEVFIDGTKLQEVLAQSPVEVQQQFAQDMPEVVAQIAEAAAIDGTVRVPVEDYATHIAGTEVDTAVLPHLRAEMEGLTYAQAQTEAAEAKEQMQAEAEQVLEANKADEEYQADAQQVYDTLLTRIESAGRFTPDANKKYAALQQAYFITRAKKLGVKPSELLARFNLQVQAERTGAAGELEQVSPEQALQTNVPLELPTDPAFAEAVGNTPGAEITKDGLLIDLVRYQKQEQEGVQAIRTGVFYLPRGTNNERHYKNKGTLRAGNAYGGTQEFRGETLLRKPLFVKGATGGKMPEMAYDAIKGKGAYAKMSADVRNAVLGWGRTGARVVENTREMLKRYGAAHGIAGEIVRNSREGNQLYYAVTENIIAHAVREAGYDAAVGYSKKKTGLAISEVFDVREQTYPSEWMESDVHEKYMQGPTFQERRAQERLRMEDLEKPVTEMTAEELHAAITRLRQHTNTNPLTGLPSKAVWETKWAEGKGKAFVASLDVDALKWFNDNIGHEIGGNVLLNRVGAALLDAGVDAYHISGDEFYAMADTQEELDNALQKAQNDLSSTSIEGGSWKVEGVGFSYGIATNMEDAENGLQENKKQREAAGLRSGRGNAPGGAVQTGNGNVADGTRTGSGSAAQDQRGTKRLASSDYGYRARDKARKATLDDFAPGKVQDILRKTDWAILTAENPNAEQLSPEENAARNAELEADLKKMGVEYTKAQGKYGSLENSFVITGITREQAMAIGEEFGQEVIFTREGLVHRDGTVEPALAIDRFAPRQTIEAGRLGEVTVDAVCFAGTPQKTLEGEGTFYIGDAVGEGAFRHELTLTNIYDGVKNPLGFPKAEMADAVLRAGFDGYLKTPKEGVMLRGEPLEVDNPPALAYSEANNKVLFQTANEVAENEAPTGKLSPQDLADLRKLWALYTAGEDAAQYGVSQAKSSGNSAPELRKALETTLNDVLMGRMEVAVKDITHYWSEGSSRLPSGGVALKIVSGPKDAAVFINTEARTFHIDISRWGEGGGGSGVYKAIFEFAKNNDLVFNGDPMGISTAGIKRRLENMLSHAIQTGETKHMLLHKRQLDFIEQETGVPLRWKDGDSKNNVEQMLNAAYNLANLDIPEIRNVYFDFAQNLYTDSRTGESSASLDRYVAKARRNPDAVRREGAPGAATVARAVFSNTLLRARSPEARRSVFDSMARFALDGLPGAQRLLYQSAAGGELTPEFKRWSGGGEVVEPEDVNDYVFKSGTPVVLKVFHGTTHKFSVFDALKGNLEGQFGAINYFTSSFSDANDNYAGEGPDLTSRVEQRAERLEQEISDAYIAAGAEGKSTKEAARALKKQFGADVYDIDHMTMARNIARKELHGGESATMELYVKVENPFVIGENAEWLQFTDDEGVLARAVAQVADDEGITVDEVEASHDDYEDRIDEARWDIEANEPNKLVEAIIAVADKYGVEAGNLALSVYDLGSEAKPSDVEALLRASEDYAYAEHPETGGLIQSQMIAEVIQELGFDAIILRNAETRFKNMNIAQGTAHVHVFEAGKNNIKSLQNTGAFDPSNPDIYLQKNRGTFNPDTLTISLLKDADLTTFLHETGHFFLENEAALASDPNAPQEIREDFLKTLNWLGIADLATWQEMPFEQKRAYHEKFARGFEAYLFEGKAPSNNLREVFASFKAWLLHIYRSITNLNVELTDEVRGVFDRMLAADEEIDAMHQQRAMKAAMIEGMSPEEKAAYLALAGDAESTAKEELERRSLRNMRWLNNARSKIIKELQREQASKRKEVRAEVTAEVMAEPINKARTFLRKGEMVDENTGDLVKAEKGFRLNTGVVAEMYPTTMLSRPDLSKLRGMTASDGLHPDLIADMFGLRSGDAMIRELIDGENPREKIEGITDQRMLERYGDLYDQQAIERAADEAIHNEARAKFMATGLKALTKSKLPVSQLVKAATDAAEETISAKKIRDLHPKKYQAAETRANKDVLKKAAKKPEEAKRAQRSALLNNRLSKAALDALEDVRKGVDRMNKVQKNAVQANMRGEYLAQLNALLDRFDLRKSKSLSAIDQERTPLATWLTEESDRLSAVVPDLPAWVLNETTRKHYKELTVEEFRGLTDAVKQLEMLARREQNQYQAIRGMKFEAERTALLERIREFHPEAFSLDGEPLGMSPKFVKHLGDTVKELGDKFSGEFLNAETIVNLLEGGEFGIVHESLFGRMSKQADWKATKIGEIYQQMAPLFTSYSLKERFEFGRDDIGAPIGMSLTRENALVVALLHGNAEGRERLANYGWPVERQQQIIDLLDERDMALAQGIWDLFDNQLWPELKALNDRTRGKSPPKVEAVEVEHKGKKYRGGYFRLKYDTNLDERAHRMDEGAAVKELLGGGLGMSAKTNQGSSTERKQNVTMRPRLDLGVFSEAVNETVHDLAYREAVADTMRMMNDTRVQNTIKTAAGTPSYRALVTRVREIAAPPRNPSGFIEKTLTVARKNTIVTSMSGVNTALQNFTGFVSAASRVNPGLLAKEIALFYSPEMASRYEFVMSQSEYMRNRYKSWERDLQNEIKKLTINASVMPDTSTFLALMGMVDKGTSVPVWNTAFKEGMAKFDNDKSRAVDYADHIVRQTQGSGRELDVAQIMSGHGGYGQLKRVFTMFYSYFNAQLGMLVRSGAVNARLAKTNPGLAAAKFTKDFMLVFVLPAVLTEMLFHPGRGEDDDDWVHRYGHAIAMYGVAMFPIVRDIGSFAWSSFDKSVPNYGLKLTPVQSAGEGVVKGLVSARDIAIGEGDQRDAKNVIMGTSFAVGLPGKLISDTTLGTTAWLEGDAGPEAVIYGPPRK